MCAWHLVKCITTMQGLNVWSVPDTLMYPKYISSNTLLKVLLRKMKPKSGLKNQISLEYLGYYYLAKIAKLCIDKNYWNDLDNVKKKCEPTLTIKRTWNEGKVFWFTWLKLRNSALTTYVHLNYLKHADIRWKKFQIKLKSVPSLVYDQRKFPNSVWTELAPNEFVQVSFTYVN